MSPPLTPSAAVQLLLPLGESHTAAVLLGRTRARTLAALHDTATTGELARRLRISTASASQHVHAPAAANLARSHRVGSQVLHTLTPLGEALLRGRLSSDGSVT
ncbi:hypothetical protein [Streptomyces umbrinus]|uniref:hypothetical protein n=1 Tax=Streptomyces umbrinus TaxID=67370 RepID=UPI00340B8ABC